MATFLDIGLLQTFSIIFPFLLVFAVVWGILSYSKIFGNNNAVQALIAAIFGFMTLLSDTVVQIINTMAPWFVLLIIFILLIMVAYLTFGGQQGDIWKFVRDSEYSGIIGWTMFIVGLVIIIGSAATVLAKQGSPIVLGGATVASTSPAIKLWALMTDPKIMGFVAIFLIAIVTVKKLTDVDTK